MSLGAKQRSFPPLVVKLILWAYEQGYEITFGDAFRDPRSHGALGEKGVYGHKNSAHKQKLAIDLNLFKDGVYLSTTEAHKPLGEYWESLGGSWGGRFEDGNHYSLEYNGMR